jgi:cell division protein ZapA (FtsZ GTPase activity inhibitor)
MAALNLAHEVISMRARESGTEQEMGHRLKTIRERVETSLQQGQQLEL